MLAFLVAAAVASDSTVYPVLNHDRPAGTMTVWRRAGGDSVTVRWVFTDRNRGTRLEARYVFRDGRVVFLESRPVLADDRSGDPTSRFEVVGDSLRRWTPARTAMEVFHPDVYYAPVFTPFDEATAAHFLLQQPGRTTKIPGATGATMRLDIVKEITVQTSRGKERARLVSLERGLGDTPSLVWLDASDNLLASEADWFITVRPGAESALPALRKVEMEFRDAKGEAMNRRLLKPTSGTIAIVHGDLFDSRPWNRAAAHHRRSCAATASSPSGPTTP